MTGLQTGRYEAALGHFNRALSWLSVPVVSLGTGLDRFRVHSGMGRASYRQAIELWQESGVTPEVMAKLKSAKVDLQAAVGWDPENYEACYWMARTESALESGFSRLNPGVKNPYDASACFRQAMALRPAGISIRYLYARYLYRKGRISAIPGLVKEMMAVSPSAYWNIRTERFFNRSYFDEVESGLTLALEKKFVRIDAWKALSRLYWDKGEAEKALEVFGEYADEAREMTSEDLVYLGSLLIAAGRKDDGFDSFDLAMGLQKSGAADRIYDALGVSGQFDLFLEYSFHARDAGIESNALDLNVARGLMKQGLLPFARARLVQVNARGGDPEAFALLAKICELEKDWEQMAEMVVEGIKLEPKMAELHYLLSKAHEGRGQFEKAGLAAAKAVQLDPGKKAYKRQEQKFVIPGD